MYEIYVKQAIEHSLRFSDGEPFTLKSGKKSKYYLDCRAITMREGIRHHISAVIADIIKNNFGDDFDAVGGVATGAIATGVLTAQLLHVDSFYVRLNTKGYGTKNKVEGIPHLSNAKVILIEDVVTTCGSLCSALSAVFEAGHTPLAAISLVDRSENPRYYLDVETPSGKKNVRYFPAFVAREPGVIEAMK